MYCCESSLCQSWSFVLLPDDEVDAAVLAALDAGDDPDFAGAREATFVGTRRYVRRQRSWFRRDRRIVWLEPGADLLDRALDASDADVDWNLNDGILTIECGDGSKLIVNRHDKNSEIRLKDLESAFDAEIGDQRVAGAIDADLVVAVELDDIKHGKAPSTRRGMNNP